MKRNRSQKPRGIVLLVVLGLLAMFGLLAVAFIVLTSHARESAEAVSRIEQQADDPRETLHQALLQLLRGTNNPASVIGPHSLLEDMYGNQSKIGLLTQEPVDLARGTLLAIEHKVSDTIIPNDSGNWQLDNNAYARIGCVLTMFEGPAAGHSTLIVSIGSPPAGQAGRPSPGMLHILPFKGDVDPPNAGDRFVINGQRFSGGGFGFNAKSLIDIRLGFNRGTNKFDHTDTAGRSLALLPNHPLNRGMDIAQKGRWKVEPWLVGPNEDYDVPDFQNMFMAAQIHDLVPDPNGGSQLVEMVYTIPSFHRPALIKYWESHDLTDELVDQAPVTYPDPYRYVTMRPSIKSNAEFVVNNLNFDRTWDGIIDPSATNGSRWDVDNDGDGLTDSIWIDAGLPVRSTPDGRLYKPLVAILCVDMDGRLNLNAHGSWHHLAPVGVTSVNDLTPVDPRLVPEVSIPPGSSRVHRFADNASASSETLLPKGQGYGTADINLLPLFQDYSSPNDHLEALLGGAGQPGRYGELGQTNPPPLPGKSEVVDPLSYNKNIAILDDYWTFLNAPGSYVPDLFGSPHDLFGVGAIGLDVTGRPLYVGMGAAAENNPYEIDLSLLSCRGLISYSSVDFPDDNPFSPAELEAVLRPYDRDRQTLSNRLLELSKPDPQTPPDPRDPLTQPHPRLNIPALQTYRHAVTTESWSIPCPAMAVPDSRVTADPQPRALTVGDLLRQNGIRPNYGPELVGPELAAGLKMNLNRPFGNGFDDNGDNTVDNPGEAANEQITVRYLGRSNPQLTANLDHDNNGVDGQDTQYSARQLYARHLYMLMYLTVDRDQMLSQLTGNGATPPTMADVSRMLAQWAVNVVDFRDRDSIMTRFSYDPNPLSGAWTPGGAQYTVFGCERPELLITETLAFHDRRTENLDDGGGKWDPDPATSKDDNFDSSYRPQGSLFIELFNPWSWVEPPTGELHHPLMAAVQLNRTTPDDDSPVWRLLICKANDGRTYDGQEFRTPDDDTSPQALTPAEKERVIYFVASGDMKRPDDADEDVMYTPSTTADTLVHPGRYAVIGPPGMTYMSLVEDIPAGEPTRTGARRINMRSNGIDDLVRSNGAPVGGLAGRVHDPALLEIGESQPANVRMSVSEPRGGYPRADPTTGKYLDAHLQPLDETENSDLWNEILKDNDTKVGGWIVHLQRLANPLKQYRPKTDPQWNPYRTIDSMPIDLTSFNGTSNEQSPHNQGIASHVFASRRRGEREHRDNPGQFNIWKQESLTLAGPAGNSVTLPDIPNKHYYNQKLKHSLGYLNEEYFLQASSTAGYKGEPQQPFPWFTFNNRPFISQMELMLVPTLRSSKLLARRVEDPAESEHEYFAFPEAGEQLNPYDPGTDAHGHAVVPYPHLLNFFRSDVNSARFYRILDFLYVPSRFVGTEEETDPQAMSIQGEDHWYHPPYHRIPRYREPGRININTIFQPEVWNGLANGFPYGIPGEELGPQPQLDPNPIPVELRFWEKLIRSRRGYDDTNVAGGSTDRSKFQKAMLALNPDLPTRFARPFRSGTAGQLAPDITAPADVTNPNGVFLRPKDEIESTLLRPDLPDPSDPTPRRALFEYTSLRPVDDTNRNPYFRYQGIQRLGNLVTTQSNVYAVWITVGYFEVTQLQGNPSWREFPDGCQIGAELGLDTGEINRHRAFYLIDRSIPVGFRRGMDLNVEDAILLRRFIE